MASYDFKTTLMSYIEELKLEGHSDLSDSIESMKMHAQQQPGQQQRTGQWDPSYFTTEQGNNAFQDYKHMNGVRASSITAALQYAYPKNPYNQPPDQQGQGIVIMSNPVDSAAEIAKIIGHLKSLGRNVKCSPEITIKLANVIDYAVSNGVISSNTANQIIKKFAKNLGV